MGRYGKSCEQRFRQNFSKDFDWLEFNLSLSERILTGDRKAIATVNLAKVLAKKRGIPFSMISCKTMLHNAFLLERFICVSGIKPDRRLNDKLVKELVEFAAIAA